MTRLTRVIEEAPHGNDLLQLVVEIDYHLYPGEIGNYRSFGVGATLDIRRIRVVEAIGEHGPVDVGASLDQWAQEWVEDNEFEVFERVFMEARSCR